MVVQAEPTAGADVSVSSPRWKSPARGNAAPKAAAVGRTGFAVRPPIPDVAMMVLLLAETGGQVAPE